MNRQKTRKALMLVSFVLLPVTLNYFSPYLPVAGAAQGLIAGSAIVFAALAVSAVVFGRAFCGWLCPVGSVQDMCMETRSRRIKGSRIDWLKYAIFVPWVALGIGLAIKAGGIHSVKPTYMMDAGVSVDSALGLVRLYMVVAPIIILAFVFGRRTFCHSLCWIAPFLVAGDFLRRLLRVPGLRLTPKPATCTSCAACTRACPMSLDVKEMVRRNNMENTECILCGRCADTCPSTSISLGFRARGGQSVCRKESRVVHTSTAQPSASGVAA